MPMGLGTWDANKGTWKTAVGTPARGASVAAQTALLQKMRQSTQYTQDEIGAAAAVLAGLTTKAAERLIVTRCDGASGVHSYAGVRMLGTGSYALLSPGTGHSATPSSRVCSVQHGTPPHTSRVFSAKHAWQLLPIS
jgi:hypothetical protein